MWLCAKNWASRTGRHRRYKITRTQTPLNALVVIRMTLFPLLFALFNVLE